MKTYKVEISHRGKSHIKRNMPNQDATVVSKIRSKKGTIYIAGCFDGVSQCKNADKASMFLADNYSEILKEEIEKNEGLMSMSVFKESIENLYKKYISEISDLGDLSEEIMNYGTTLEVAVLQKDNAYTIHAGDGLISILHTDGSIELSKAEGHVGKHGAVKPFFEKSTWEYQEYSDVAGIMISTDGVYDEIVPTPIRRSEYEYDLSILLPFFDMRGHKSYRSYKRYIDLYISGKLNEESIKSACYRFVNKKLLQGVTNEEINNIVESKTYKFVNSKDDLSLVLLVNKSKLPERYNGEHKIPDYYKLWLKEQEKLRGYKSSK